MDENEPNWRSGPITVTVEEKWRGYGKSAKFEIAGRFFLCEVFPQNGAYRIQIRSGADGPAMAKRVIEALEMAVKWIENEGPLEAKGSK